MVPGTTYANAVATADDDDSPKKKRTRRATRSAGTSSRRKLVEADDSRARGEAVASLFDWTRPGSTTTSARKNGVPATTCRNSSAWLHVRGCVHGGVHL